MEAAHAAVGGTGPVRRHATQQINQAYAVMLSSQFQLFCRDLHTEAADVLTQTARAPDVRLTILRAAITEGRKLDSGNPNPGNIGSDFDRLGFSFWGELNLTFPDMTRWRNSLEELNRWRNAIAHQDFDPVRLGGLTTLRLERVRVWRRGCNLLANRFERVTGIYLSRIIGHSPW
jgi:hypothetical protein